ncbi:MAG: LysM peptidoglycan-binding domain-containing protein [Myxococcota bacterium]
MKQARGLALALGAGGVLALMQVAAAQAPDAIDGRERDWRPTLDSYTVERGDTLWDISARVVGRAALWPRIWAYNPEITNPNWIYPGDILRFQPSDQPLPMLSEPSSTPMLVSQKSDVTDLGTRNEDEAHGHAAIEVINTRPAVSRTPAGPPPPREWLTWIGAFVTPEELARAGTLTHAVGDKLLLSNNDEVYLSFPGEQKPIRGERFLVYRTLGRVRHPVSHDLWGYMSQVTGVVTVDGNEPAVTRAHLGTTLVEVERGQYVAPLKQDLRSAITEIKAPKAVDGVVLALSAEAPVMAGEQQLVFVDKGTDAGLVRGNRFKVYERGDPVTHDYSDLPYVDIATLLVVDVKDNASTCLVLSSTREIEPGDRVEAVTQ